MPDLRCQGCPLFGQVINALCTLDKRFDVASLLQIVGRVLSPSLFAGFFLAVCPEAELCNNASERLTA